MTGRGGDAAAALADVRGALEATAQALAAADLEALLRSEARLELAIEGLMTLRPRGPADRAALRNEAERVGIALTRCRRLGESMRELVRASFEAQGRGAWYGRAAPNLPGSVVARG
jgi:hypothetical protein